jgi:hypothetical protein
MRSSSPLRAYILKNLAVRTFSALGERLILDGAFITSLPVYVALSLPLLRLLRSALILFASAPVTSMVENQIGKPQISRTGAWRRSVQKAPILL